MLVSPRAAALSAVLGAALFGTAGTAQALGPDGTTPLAVGAVRLAIGGTGLVAVLPLLGHPRREVLRWLREPLVLATAVCVAAYQACFFAGVDRAGVAVGTLVTVGAAPVLAGLLGWAAGHRPAAAWAGATAVCLAGLALLSADALGGGDPLGVLLALGAALAIATTSVLVKHLLDRGAPSAPVLAAGFTVAALLVLPPVVVQPLGWVATPRGVVLALWLGLATMTVANVLYGRGLTGLPPGPVTTLMLADPLVATALGVLLLDEALPAAAVAGLLLLLTGLLLQAAALSRRAPPVSPEPAAPL